MRLVSPDGEQIGIIPTPEALSRASALGLDLVEVADKANPPVCRIMDYGKYKYENAQRQKESRKKSSNVQVKEMKYRPKIGRGDFDTKTRKVKHFLEEGNRVKLTIMFRGREMQHPELGRKILDQVADEAENVSRIEVYPKLDGRNMIMVLVPDKEKIAEKHAQEKAAAEAAEAEAAGEELANEESAPEPSAIDESAENTEAAEPAAADPAPEPSGEVEDDADAGTDTPASDD